MSALNNASKVARWGFDNNKHIYGSKLVHKHSLERPGPASLAAGLLMPDQTSTNTSNRRICGTTDIDCRSET